MVKSVRTSLLFLTAILLCLPTKASSMTVLAADLPDLVRDSQAIIHAVVTQVENVVLNEAGQPVSEEELRKLTTNDRPDGLRAFTDVTLHIFESFKGTREAGTTLKLRLVGGQMGPFTLRIPGMPGFQSQTEVFLFLHETALGFTPVGAGQGVFRIQRNGPNNAVAVHDMKGMAVLRQQVVPQECGDSVIEDGACAPQMGAGFPAIPNTMPLESLDAQVRALLGLPPAKGLRVAPATFPKQR
jgi:hypothetical protein